jgi:hypothetical protein
LIFSLPVWVLLPLRDRCFRSLLFSAPGRDTGGEQLYGRSGKGVSRISDLWYPLASMYRGREGGVSPRAGNGTAVGGAAGRDLEVGEVPLHNRTEFASRLVLVIIHKSSMNRAVGYIVLVSWSKMVSTVRSSESRRASFPNWINFWRQIKK